MKRRRIGLKKIISIRSNLVLYRKFRTQTGRTGSKADYFNTPELENHGSIIRARSCVHKHGDFNMPVCASRGMVGICMHSLKQASLWVTLLSSHLDLNHIAIDL